MPRRDEVANIHMADEPLGQFILQIIQQHSAIMSLSPLRDALRQLVQGVVVVFLVCRGGGEAGRLHGLLLGGELALQVLLQALQLRIDLRFGGLVVE